MDEREREKEGEKERQYVREREKERERKTGKRVCTNNCIKTDQTSLGIYSNLQLNAIACALRNTHGAHDAKGISP